MKIMTIIFQDEEVHAKMRHELEAEFTAGEEFDASESDSGPATNSRASTLPHALLLELHKCKGTVRCVALDTEFPRHSQHQMVENNKTLIVRM